MAKERTHRRFSFKWFFFIISAITITLVYYDLKQQGSWQKSNSKRILKESGADEYIEIASAKVRQGLLWVDGNIEQNFPGYHKKLEEFSTPYVELGKNLAQLTCNVANNIKEVILEKYPEVIKSIESYAPGLMEQSQNAVSSVWASSIFYYNRSIDYLKKEVFVGQLSPENMQRVVFEALNTTQIKASEYYHWLYEKVQTTIK